MEGDSGFIAIPRNGASLMPESSQGIEASPACSLVEVMVLTRVGKPLHYAVPDGMALPEIGCLVRVPLNHRHEVGIVTAHPKVADFPMERIRPVMALLHPFPVVSVDVLAMMRWVARYYACSLDSVLEKGIPSAIRKDLREAQERYLMVTAEGRKVDLETLGKKAPKQRILLDFLRSQSMPMHRGRTLQSLELSAAIVKPLVDRAWIEELTELRERLGYDDLLGQSESVKRLDYALTEEQASAVETLRGALDAGGFRSLLLHGVTGSGKTEVYCRAIQHALADPLASALFLVPEVALAPQTVGNLRSRLESMGVKVLVWHSHLSDGERRDSWLKIARGEARVVVGARSAVFTPLRHLRLVIVDEEHEPAYKQEEIPRYHGRDLAVFRARLNHACCVLGSATPSLESLYNVKVGKYACIKLTKRVDDRQLPKVTLVDMRLEYRKQKREGILSERLRQALLERFEKREQSILFLNRRGFSPQMVCPACGWVALSDECSVPLTFHRKQNLLKCHLSGFEMPAPSACPSCGSQAIRGEGFGTQKLEDLVKAFLPRAKVFRIDADTMQRKHLFREVLADFRVGKLDILVGTQMIAKGLDFPNVTLVGMINADHSLYMGDFRATERTFQLLVQVAGRAGRGERAGEVIIQTSTPHASPIQFARRNDFDGFLEEEIELRREFNYPPFRHLIRHILKGRNREQVEFYATKWKEHLDAAALPGVEVRGPIPAMVEKINGEYRFQLWYFTPKVMGTVERLQELVDAFQWDRQVQQLLDVDAFNLL
jgi:primosomal protein N' (replication factor Y)